MKTQFQSGEDLQIDVAPFLDLTTSPPVEVAGDSVTVSVTSPTGTHPAVTLTQDATTKIWSGSIAQPGGYIQGKWRFRIVSNNANTSPQYLVLQWGDYVDKIDAAVSSRATPSDVTSARDSIKGAGLPDIASVKAKTDLIPASPASTGDVTAARDSVKGADSRDLTQVYNWTAGKVVVDAGGLASFYTPNGVTLLGTAQIKKLDGSNYIPSASEPTQRVP